MGPRVQSAWFFTVLLHIGSASHAQQPVMFLDRMFPIGSDFCMSRSYSAQHMATHPRQVIKSITLMGRNAHRKAAEPGEGKLERTVSGFNVRASLRVTFRDGKPAREWPGTCRQDEVLPGYAVFCAFIPHRNVDSVEFSLGLRKSGEAFQAITQTDIAAFRKADEDTGNGPRGVLSDDTYFVLQAIKAPACSYSPRYWPKKGATRALEEHLP